MGDVAVLRHIRHLHPSNFKETDGISISSVHESGQPLSLGKGDLHALMNS